jgi:hypothetical protein
MASCSSLYSHRLQSAKTPLRSPPQKPRRGEQKMSFFVFCHKLNNIKHFGFCKIGGVLVVFVAFFAICQVFSVVF